MATLSLLLHFNWVFVWTTLHHFTFCITLSFIATTEKYESLSLTIDLSNWCSGLNVRKINVILFLKLSDTYVIFGIDAYSFFTFEIKIHTWLAWSLRRRRDWYNGLCEMHGWTPLHVQPLKFRNENSVIRSSSFLVGVLETNLFNKWLIRNLLLPASHYSEDAFYDDVAAVPAAAAVRFICSPIPFRWLSHGDADWIPYGWFFSATL